MTKQEFNEALKALNLTKKDFCEKLRINYASLVGSWFRVVPMPQYAISWLELYKTAQKYEQFAEILENHPALKGFIKKADKADKTFTRKDFDSRLKGLKLSRAEFCQMVGISYVTPNSWDKYSPIPLWVEAWLNTYENVENVKKLESLLEDA